MVRNALGESGADEVATLLVKVAKHFLSNSHHSSDALISLFGKDSGNICYLHVSAAIIHIVLVEDGL
jgi:hypothetical protein